MATFVRDGTTVPWELIPVATTCNVSPLELARKNLMLIRIGLTCIPTLARFMFRRPDSREAQYIGGLSPLDITHPTARHLSTSRQEE